jgi:hypothetical protein
MEMSTTPLAATPTSDDAAVQRILTTARSDSPPQGWYVWHLQRDRVMRAGLGWLFIGLVGLVLLIPTTIGTIPGNFNASAALAAFTIVLLLILAGMAIGGLGLVAGEAFRYLRADEYLLVMTPDDYVKVTPRGITHVPMTSIAFVTLKGVRTQTMPVPGESTPTSPALGWGLMFAGNTSSRMTARSAPSLAFLDLRTEKQVVVATDNMFADLPILEEVLSLYARGRPTKTPLL